MAKRKELIRFSLELVIIVAVTATVCTKIVVPVKIQGDSTVSYTHLLLHILIKSHQLLIKVVVAKILYYIYWQC